MELNARYRNEIEFSDSSAETVLSKLPRDLDLTKVECFENLCENIRYLRSIPEFYGDLSGKRILEMGCGNGWISLRMAKSGAQVWACDISPKMIQLAEKCAEAARLNVKFQTMVCEEMTYEDSFFDFVFMHFALHHCDITATAREISRVLKPGGKAVVVEDYAYHPLMKLYRVMTPSGHTENEHPLTKEEVSLFVSFFTSCSLEYYGLTNVFELTDNRIIRPIRPILRGVDNFLYEHLGVLKRFSKIIIGKVVK